MTYNCRGTGKQLEELMSEYSQSFFMNSMIHLYYFTRTFCIPMTIKLRMGLEYKITNKIFAFLSGKACEWSLQIPFTFLLLNLPHHQPFVSNYKCTGRETCALVPNKPRKSFHSHLNGLKSSEGYKIIRGKVVITDLPNVCLKWNLWAISSISMLEQYWFQSSIFYWKNQK